MPEPTLIQREREALHALIQLAAERDRSESEVETSRASRDARADEDYHTKSQELTERYHARKEAARAEDERRRNEITQAFIAGEAEAKSVFARVSRKAASDFDRVRETSKAEYGQAKWEANTVSEAAEKGAATRYAEAKARIDDAVAVLEDQKARLTYLYDAYKKFGLREGSTTPAPSTYKFDDPIARLHDDLAKIEPDLELLEGLVIPKSMKTRGDVGIILFLFAALAFPFWSAIGGAAGLGVAFAVALAVGIGLRFWLYGVAGKQVARLYYPLSQSLADAEALAAHCLAWAQDNLKRQRAEITQRRDQEIERAKKKMAQAITQGEANRDDLLRKANEAYTRKINEVHTRQHDDMKAAVTAYAQLKAEMEAKYASDTQALEEKYRELKASVKARYEAAWNAMRDRWTQGLARVDETLREAQAEVARLNPGWDGDDVETRPLPAEIPHLVQFGAVPIGLDQIEHGNARDARLMAGVPTKFRFPAVMPFPDRGNLIIEAAGDAGKEAGVAMLQAVMMRLLTSLPPGKVRFTLIDPVGLGRNFAGFMHLADFDEQLVTNRVWTEPMQIEQRLADLSAHMEKVIQKYLRNEYATIEEYNARAGEVAEPFRVLVIADFPVNFDEGAATRLVRIASSGIRCGVLTLIMVDKDRELPPGLKLDDLRTHAQCFSWNGKRLVWKEPDFASYPLALDVPPAADRATTVLHRIGAAAKDANRVEVPFEFIAPPPDRAWTFDSRGGIDIALGKAGATKRQPLMLGKGTSQHALVAGRTGSGKSTLLHALITNLAISYSPDEVEMYLIDFKKGVEFKTYATHELPHAKVVAIESEREFGVSVLQRLDGVLKERADLFRDAGVQDLRGFRDQPGSPPLPRVLLIVDEFQEFFVEDDKVAQEASLLLDRLVRQGRAFGVHVILGSQTLGGAYALARSTLGQMAVRIALQCSEADAHLILSEDNAAAKLLSRPGEAVYNDANGMAEGNHFFQVVWLSDERREGYLNRINELTRQRRPVLARRPIVFEGNVAADIEANVLLNQRLEADDWPDSPRSALAWLGDAVAIKDPSAALFRRQGGNNLLIVGQNDESALAIMMTALISLGAQFAPPESDTTRSGAKFYVLDGTPEDSPLAGRLGRAVEVLPHPVEYGAARDVSRFLTEVADEVARRQQPDAPDGPEIFLLIHDIQRFRDLRKRDDDFGFGRRDEPASPSDQLATILREGPVLGVHVLTWCDNLNNLNRTFDRQALREFETRVLFQMSQTDSSHLIDSPQASRLGPHRAFLSSEEEGRLEKFRPYGLPRDAWLERVRQQLAQRRAAVRG